MIPIDQLVTTPIKVWNLPNSCTVQSRLLVFFVLLVFFILARYADPCSMRGLCLLVTGDKIPDVYDAYALCWKRLIEATMLHCIHISFKRFDQQTKPNNVIK